MTNKKPLNKIHGPIMGLLDPLLGYNFENMGTYITYGTFDKLWWLRLSCQNRALVAPFGSPECRLLCDVTRKISHFGSQFVTRIRALFSGCGVWSIAVHCSFSRIEFNWIIGKAIARQCTCHVWIISNNRKYTTSKSKGILQKSTKILILWFFNAATPATG